MSKTRAKLMCDAKSWTVWVCRGDLEQEWALALCESQRAAEDLDADLAIEAELGRWPERDGMFEEAALEYVPVHIALENRSHE